MTLRAHVQKPLHYYLTCDAVISGPVCTASTRGIDIHHGTTIDAQRDALFSDAAERGWSVHSSPHTEKGPDYCAMHTRELLGAQPGWHSRPDPLIQSGKTYIPPVI